MKKILFVLPHMLAGGVETALLALLTKMDRLKYDISVLFVKEEGQFLSLLPKDVQVGELPLSTKHAEEILHGRKTSIFIKQAVKNGNITLAIQILYRKIIKKDPLAKFSVPFSKVKKLDEFYDVAICFHAHCPFILKYVAEKVQSKIKLIWIHNDFKSTNFDIAQYRMQIEMYDKIYCVSQDLKNEFVEIFPQIETKVDLFHNIIPIQEISRKAIEYYPAEYQNVDIPIILSVGRLNHQKGFDLAVIVSKNLNKHGIVHKWFILGEGEQRDELEKQIAAAQMENTFILLGIHPNPYPYIKNCTIYVQPSRHEGYGIAVAEARALEVPIICTDFAGAREQIVSGENGIIVPFAEKQLTHTIAQLLTDKKMREQLSEQLRQQNKFNIANDELNNFIELVDEIG